MSTANCRSAQSTPARILATSSSPSYDSNQTDVKSSISNVPNAMDQSIFGMLTKANPHIDRDGRSIANIKNVSNQISSLSSAERMKYSRSSQSLKEQSIHVNTGIPRHFQYMSYPIPWRATAGPDEIPPDFTWMQDSCVGKAAIGVFAGAGCGLVMGVFLGAMSDMTPPVTIINGKEVPQAPLREQMRTTLRATGEKSLYWARNFAFITGVFGATDCLVEKYRGKHDVWNSVMSGCITGAAMQAKQGPQAAAIGCGGFAAFSLVIDKVMGTH